MSNDATNSAEPEYLGDTLSTASRPSRGRRAPILGLAAAAVVGVVALGGWAAVSLMSGGTQPAEAIPGDAIGYVSLDLDPSASQKIEAIQMLRKFPALEKSMNLSSEDDLRRWVFEKIQKDGQCKSVSYDQDIAPWIGDRIAVAGMPAAKAGASPTPLVALQVTDAAAADKGITELAHCGGAEGDFGIATSGDYALISDSQKHAEAFAAEAQKGSLADDPTFQKWTSRVGDPGIITMYAAPGAMDAIVDAQTNLADDFAMAPMPGGGVEEQGLLQMQSRMKQMNKRLKDAYSGFRGMAGVVRFQNGAVEAEIAGQSSSKMLAMSLSPQDRVHIADLPDGTAAAFAVALPDGWVKSYLDLMGSTVGDAQDTDQMLKQLEAQTGLQLPQDIERLFGDGMALSLDKNLDVKAASENPTAVPAGLRISGNPQEIQAALDKVKKAVGPDADQLVTESGAGVVAVGLNRDYVHELAAGGSLGDQVQFRDVVPDADKAGAAVYVDLDAVQQWVTQGMEQAGSSSRTEIEVRDNLAPLRAFGMSSWVEDDGSQHARLRLTTD
jgi:hypothetical protein